MSFRLADGSLTGATTAWRDHRRARMTLSPSPPGWSACAEGPRQADRKTKTQFDLFFRAGRATVYELACRRSSRRRRAGPFAHSRGDSLTSINSPWSPNDE